MNSFFADARFIMKNFQSIRLLRKETEFTAREIYRMSHSEIVKFGTDTFVTLVPIQPPASAKEQDRRSRTLIHNFVAVFHSLLIREGELSERLKEVSIALSNEKRNKT